MEVICLDTDLLIHHRRAKQKDLTRLYELASHYRLAVTVITVFELLKGDSSEEDKHWLTFFSKVDILSLDLESATLAGHIYRELKQSGNMIGVQDLFIGAIAKRNQMKLATDNVKHFSRIEGLELV